MSYHHTGAGVPEDSVCRYGESKLQFRGPQRSLEGSYIACLGGEETFGRFVERPYAAILEQRLDRKSVNFGSLFCGLEALTKDQTLPTLTNNAELCVLQVPGALGHSNHFYRVHPRRNDRFLEPSPDLVSLYPEVDFTDVHFVRHLLGRLHGFRDARFEIIIHELRRVWAKKMEVLLGRITSPVLLLWLRVDGADAQKRAGPIGCDPALVDVDMIENIAPRCAGVIELSVQMSGESDDLEDMLFGTLQQPMAEHMIGPATHRRIADALNRSIRDLN